MPTDSVQILLSTYNGAEYLRPQLDSYLKLEGAAVKVLIRDDGSTDGTVAILDEYAEKHGFEIYKGENLGYIASMFRLIEHRDKSCGYYATSDQDDVWLPNKLRIALEHIHRVEMSQPVQPTPPVLFASLSSVVDSHLNPIGKSYAPGRGPSFYNAMVQNIAPGHTHVFNSSLMQLLDGSHHPDILVLDWWIYLIATAFGEVTFSEECTVLHRQHSDNSIGYELNPIRHFFQRLRRLADNHNAGITQQLQAFRQCFGEWLPEGKYKEIESFLAKQGNILKRLGYCRKTRCYRQSALETLIFKLLYIAGHYSPG